MLIWPFSLFLGCPPKNAGVALVSLESRNKTMYPPPKKKRKKKIQTIVLFKKERKQRETKKSTGKRPTKDINTSFIINKRQRKKKKNTAQHLRSLDSAPKAPEPFAERCAHLAAAAYLEHCGHHAVAARGQAGAPAPMREEKPPGGDVVVSVFVGGGRVFVLLAGLCF